MSQSASPSAEHLHTAVMCSGNGGRPLCSASKGMLRSSTRCSVARTGEHDRQDYAVVLGGAARPRHEDGLAREVTCGRPRGLHGAGRQVRLADAREPRLASLHTRSQMPTALLDVP